MVSNRSFGSGIDAPAPDRAADSGRAAPVSPLLLAARQRACRTIVPSLLLLAAGCARWQPLLYPSRFDTLHPPARLQADTTRALELIREVHPDPFYHLSEDAFADRVRALRDRLDVPMTRREFACRLAPLLAALDDGHTRVRFPETDYLQYQRAGGRVFPLTVRVVPADAETTGPAVVAVAAAAPGDVPLPCRLSAINGRPISEVMDLFMRLTSGRNAAYRSHCVGENFGRLLWLTHMPPPFRVVWHNAHGRYGTALTSGIDPAEPPQAPLGWRVYSPAAGIRCLEWNAMTGSAKAFEAALSKLFQDLQKTDGRGLIIDLRYNSGGNSGFADMLLRYLTRKPYRLNAAKRWRLSPTYRRYARRMGYRSRRLDANPADGAVHVFSAPWRTPARAETLFQGPVAVLIGPGTYSSAALLADTLREFGLGTLFGAMTGGSPGGFGEICTARLPRTQLELDIASARFVRLNGNPEDRAGVRPHQRVTTDAEALLNAEDPVLDAAVAWIAETARPDR